MHKQNAILSFICLLYLTTSKQILVEYDEDEHTISYQVFSLLGCLLSSISIGYFSNDDLVLELRLTSGNEEEKRCAEKIMPILSNRNWLFATVLLLNCYSIVCTVLFLTKIVHSKIAVVLSIALVVIFNEIIPQMICSGAKQLSFAAKAADFTRALMKITSPITFFLGKLFDRLLGEKHKARLFNADLKALIQLHKRKDSQKINEKDIQMEEKTFPDADDTQRKNQGLNEEEANLMISALEIREKQVMDFMISIKSTYMIDYDERIDKPKLKQIIAKGFSRIPVYANHNEEDILGLVRIKQLISIDINNEKTLRELGIRIKAPLVIRPTLSIIELLRDFRKGKSHMAFITEQVEKLQSKFGLTRTNSVSSGLHKVLSFQTLKEIKILGIVTLEDVIEQIFKLDILDEDDYEKQQHDLTNKINGGRSFKRNYELQKIEEDVEGISYRRNLSKNELLDNNSDTYLGISKPSSEEQKITLL